MTNHVKFLLGGTPLSSVDVLPRGKREETLKSFILFRITHSRLKRKFFIFTLLSDGRTN